MKNQTEKAQEQRFHSICSFVFMHGVSEHQGLCSHRHLLLPSDILDESEQITSGHLRFNMLKIISPTEYIVRPTSHPTSQHGEKWSTINKSDEFDRAEIIDIYEKRYVNRERRKNFGSTRKLYTK